MMYGLYGVLLRLAWAVVLPYQFVIALLTGGAVPRLRERLGLIPPRPGAAADAIWIHAVSVGEVRLGLTLAARLRSLFPASPIHLTTVTATGRQIALAPEPGDPARVDSISDLPFDLPGSMRRLFDRMRPGAILVIETEIWPNLLRLAGGRGIPVILVNGRVSSRTFPRYRALGGFLRLPLGEVRLFAMQSRDDAERIRELGAPPERIRVTGNLKFDLPVVEIAGEPVRRSLAAEPTALVLVAGSTAPGEEGAVLEAFARLRRSRSDARLVMAPRHPKDLSRARAAIAAAGLRQATWSRLVETPAPREGHDVILVDVVGILPRLYAAADLVFVGGSLVRRGGHNVLEPAALGKPVLFGPHMQNFAAAARALTEAGAGFIARDGSELAALVERLAADPTARRVAGTMGREVVRANRGALDRTLGLIAADLAALHPRIRQVQAAPSPC